MFSHAILTELVALIVPQSLYFLAALIAYHVDCVPPRASITHTWICWDCTPTAIIFFSDKKKEIEKKYLKLKNRYSKDGAYNFKYLTSQDFLFTTVKPDESLLNRKETTSKKKK